MAPDPQATTQIDLLLKIVFMLLAFALTILQAIGTYYFRQIKTSLHDLTYMFFHHRHKDCSCDADGKGDVFIPTEYQR